MIAVGEIPCRLADIQAGFEGGAATQGEGGRTFEQSPVQLTAAMRDIPA